VATTEIEVNLSAVYKIVMLLGAFLSPLFCFLLLQNSNKGTVGFVLAQASKPGLPILLHFPLVLRSDNGKET
jgi:hypothetical protein